MSRVITGVLLAAALFSCGTRGPEGPPGPQGPQGPAGPGAMSGPSVSSVVPSAVTQGSEYDVTISGFATDWTDTAVVSFGQGVTVTRTKAASGTSLLVHVKVAPDAMADTRDVSVTQGMATVFWRNAFSVLPRVKFTAFGTASQMSLSVVRLEVNEPQFEFDTSGAINAVSVFATPDFSVEVLTVSQKVLDVLVLADADAGFAAHDVTVISREGSFAERTFTAPAVFTVSPQQPRPLIEGVPENGVIDKPFQSSHWVYTPAAADGGARTVVISLDSSVTTSVPRFAVVPSSGRWDDLEDFTRSYVYSPVPGEPVNLVVFEPTGATGVSYTLAVTPIQSVVEEEPNDVPQAARQLTLPGIAVAILGSLTDADWFRISVSANDVGKKLRIRTRPGDALTDTIVELFQADGVTSVGGPSPDGTRHSDLTTAALPAAGDYFVRVIMSPDVVSWDPAMSHYELVVTF